MPLLAGMLLAALPANAEEPAAESPSAAEELVPVETDRQPARRAPLLVKRVQADGRARWEQVFDPEVRSRSARPQGDVIAVSEDAIFTQSAAPNDPLYPEQWNFAQIGAEAAWSRATGSGIVVGVIDSGVTPGPDLACRTFLSPYDAETGGTTMAAVADGTGHGTHVTGTIAQCTNNGFGVAGLAYGVSIVPVRALDDFGSGSAAWIANGIAHAVASGADVVNLSFGLPCAGAVWPSCGINAVDVEIAAAVAAGVVLVAAAGNSSASTPDYPANHPDVIAVGATNSAQARTGYSNGGAALEVMAPGGDYADRDGDGEPDLIWQERPDESGSSAIVGMTGTSMAAPHVSATVAMMKQANPGWTSSWVRCVLRDTATDIASVGFDTGTGWGEIDAGDAVTHTGEAWSDVSGDAWYEPAVSFVADANVAVGYDDCTFGPNEPITRAQAAIMLVKATGLSPVGSPTGIFPDVPAGSSAAPYVEAAANAGWLFGYPDGTFRPDGLITRAELSSLVARSAGFGAAGLDEPPFSDVVPGQWFYDVVVAAWNAGVVYGYPDGTFLPNVSISRAETSQVLFNAST